MEVSHAFAQCARARMTAVFGLTELWLLLLACALTGPGSSSMYGLFAEQGPFSMSPDGSTLEMRTEGAWTSTYNVIFIDNPVGTGFSYTESAEGFVTNQVEVGQDLLSFMYQFLELYPQYQKLPLYICGQLAMLRVAGVLVARAVVVCCVSHDASL